MPTTPRACLLAWLLPFCPLTLAGCGQEPRTTLDPNDVDASVSLVECLRSHPDPAGVEVVEMPRGELNILVRYPHPVDPVLETSVVFSPTGVYRSSYLLRTHDVRRTGVAHGSPHLGRVEP
jgi:hypothetical protein